MKKIILLSFALGLVAALNAQNYPLAKDGTTWQYVFTTIDNYACRYNVVDGDTTVNGRIYKKLYSYSTRKYDRKKASFEEAFREEGERIYALPNQMTEKYLPVENGEVLLYDFSLQKGDLFPKSDMEDRSYTVKKVDYVEINGEQRKRIWFSDDDKDAWIEGIGSLNRPFALPLSDTPTNGTAYVQEMFEQDGKVLYGSRRFDLLAEGVHWTERTSTHGDVDETGKEIFELQHFTVSGDSVINGISYRKVQVNGYPYLNLREDNDGNIWYYNATLEKEGLLYPFGPQPAGAKALHYTDDSGADRIIVENTYHTPAGILPDGHRYAIYMVEESFRDFQKHPRSKMIYLIMGVGLTQGIFQHILTGDINCICYNDLVSLYNGNNELVYQNPDFKENGEFTSGIAPIRAGKLLTVAVQNGKATFSLTENQAGTHPTLSVYNTNGSLVLSRTMETETLTLNFPTGTYLYRLERDGENIEAGKFVTGK